MANEAMAAEDWETDASLLLCENPWPPMNADSHR